MWEQLGSYKIEKKKSRKWYHLKYNIESDKVFEGRTVVNLTCLPDVSLLWFIQGSNFVVGIRKITALLDGFLTLFIAWILDYIQKYRTLLEKPPLFRQFVHPLFDQLVCGVSFVDEWQARIVFSLEERRLNDLFSSLLKHVKISIALDIAILNLFCSDFINKLLFGEFISFFIFMFWLSSLLRTIVVQSRFQNSILVLKSA